ncbi:MAG: hypothetical protein WCG79_03160 [Verrucomicrobiota bacterium]|jgi:hypothetical protein
MSTDFNWAAFHRRRKFVKLAGVGMVISGLYTLVDMMGEIPGAPTLFRGNRAIIAGTALIIFGLVALYNGYKLPLEAALDLVHCKGRGLTESELVHDMRVDRLTAHRILEALIAKGFVRRSSDQAGATEEVFEPVK